MSRALPFTQAGLTRAIKAARAAGLRVTGIRPDGVLLVDGGDKAPGVVPTSGAGAQGGAHSDEWSEVEA